MSPYLLSADLAVTEIGERVRATTTIGDATDAYAAILLDEYRAARAEGQVDVMALIRGYAAEIDPALLDELAGFDYPAAA